MFCIDLRIIITIIIIPEGTISTKYLIYIFEVPGTDPAHRLPVLTEVSMVIHSAVCKRQHTP